MARKFIALMAVVLCGCSYPYFRAVDGTSMSVGITVPEQETLQLEALQYVNGSKLVVRDLSMVEYELESVETNSYFGLIHTQVKHKARAVVRPVFTNFCDSVDGP